VIIDLFCVERKERAVCTCVCLCFSRKVNEFCQRTRHTSDESCNKVTRPRNPAQREWTPQTKIGGEHSKGNLVSLHNVITKNVLHQQNNIVANKECGKEKAGTFFMNYTKFRYIVQTSNDRGWVHGWRVKGRSRQREKKKRFQPFRDFEQNNVILPGTETSIPWGATWYGWTANYNIKFIKLTTKTGSVFTFTRVLLFLLFWYKFASKLPSFVYYI
jgi:hypothetical protein